MPDPLVALVTGGGRGIGLASARRFLRDGYRVAILDVAQKALDSAATTVAESKGECRTFIASVVERPSMEAAVREVVSHWGRIDVLVNNAGINKPGGILQQTDTDWAAVLAVNLTGAFVSSGVVAPFLVGAGGGAIVNVGSIGATGMGASPAYAASKAGLIGLTKQMATELGPHGIRVNLVAPGVTQTDWVERNLGEQRLRSAAQGAPLRRVGSPEEIAGVIAFLCGPDSIHITGQVISASGGAWMP